MNWQKVVLYILGGVAIFFLGYLAHSTLIPKPTIVIKETVRYDTLTTTKTISFTKVRKDTIRIPLAFTYADSIMGDTNQVKYDIKHTIQNDKEILTSWKVNLEPRFTEIIKYITKDSVRTIIEAKYISLPFFLNTYFWSSIILVVITTLAIIF